MLCDSVIEVLWSKSAMPDPRGERPDVLRYQRFARLVEGEAYKLGADKLDDIRSKLLERETSTGAVNGLGGAVIKLRAMRRSVVYWLRGSRKCTNANA